MSPCKVDFVCCFVGVAMMRTIKTLCWKRTVEGMSRISNVGGSLEIKCRLLEKNLKHRSLGRVPEIIFKIAHFTIDLASDE